MREPSFWSRPAGFAAGMLSPVAAIYGAAAGWRMGRPGYAAGIRVICVGNLTLGGAGKTPTAIAVVKILEANGRRPFLLSRGYGGALPGPVRVDPAHHRAADVGDEPLLLARAAPTIVARDRKAGAVTARDAGADVIVMDDGFQNPALKKDCSLLVVDGGRGVGNGRMFPVGPLRAPLQRQLAHAHAVLIIGLGRPGEQVAAMARDQGLAIFHGRLEPDAAELAVLKGEGVLAFAGIGNPDKFFATLSDAGVVVSETARFADHHPYRRAEALDLIARAERGGLTLVTTEKDLARIAGQDDLAALAGVVRTLPVRLSISEQSAFRDFITALD